MSEGTLTVSVPATTATQKSGAGAIVGVLGVLIAMVAYRRR